MNKIREDYQEDGVQGTVTLPDEDSVSGELDVKSNY